MMSILESKDVGPDSSVHATNNTDNSNKRKYWGLVAAAATGSFAIGLTVITYPFVSPAFRKICLPYVPATARQMENIFKLCTSNRGSLVDLGSGDGRIVINAAQRGFIATGVELNPWLVAYSSIKARFMGLNRSKAIFLRTDIFKVHFSQFDHIVVFGVPDLMEPLKNKLRSELNSKASVIVCRFPLPECKPSGIIDEGIDSVWIYKKSDIVHK